MRKWFKKESLSHPTITSNKTQKGNTCTWTFVCNGKESTLFTPNIFSNKYYFSTERKKRMKITADCEEVAVDEAEKIISKNYTKELLLERILRIKYDPLSQKYIRI